MTIPKEWMRDFDALVKVTRGKPMEFIFKFYADERKRFIARYEPLFQADRRK
jgi:hypothetical protein